MKINRCQFCDSPAIRRGRYFGLSFIIVCIMGLGWPLLLTWLLPVKVQCLACHIEYIAS